MHESCDAELQEKKGDFQLTPLKDVPVSSGQRPRACTPNMSHAHIYSQRSFSLTLLSSDGSGHDSISTSCSCFQRTIA